MREVLKHIKPTEKEMDRELNFAKKLTEHLKPHVPDSCEVVLTGSVAKKTFLRDRRDVDVFILFPRTVPKEELEPAIKQIMDNVREYTYLVCSQPEPWSSFALLESCGPRS